MIINSMRYTTFGEALYFSDSNELRKLLTEKYYKKYKKSGDAMLKLGKEHYSWSLIADKYAQVIEEASMIKLGIVGFGRMGITHYSIINSHDSVQIVGVADNSYYVRSSSEICQKCKYI